MAAFAWLDSHERLRCAINARSHPPRYVLPPSTEVCYYRQKGHVRRVQDRETTPQGSAVVVAMEGPRNVWLRDRGSLVRAAIEKVRLATEEELRAVRREFVSLERQLSRGRVMREPDAPATASGDAAERRARRSRPVSPRRRPEEGHSPWGRQPAAAQIPESTRTA